MRRTFTLAFLFSSLFTLPLGAQAQHLRRAPSPSTEVHIDLPTGTITRGPVVQPRAAATVSDFPNMDLSGFAGVDTGGGSIEWFNDGVKGVNANASDLMDSFAFAYCSAKKDTSLGGPGGSVKLGFYEGYTRNGGPSGTPNGTAVAVLTLTGLPANSASSSFFGGFNCYFATVTFGDLVSFADGPIAYSWKFLDVGSSGPLAGTFPFLANAGVCVGTTPFTDALGQAPYTCCSVSVADVYLNGLLLVVFTFAPYCFPFSVGIDIHEAADLTATASPFIGDGINADVLTASPAIVGQNWSASVTLGHAHGSSGAILLALRTAVINGPNLNSPIGGRLTEPLISGPLLASLSSAHNGTASAPITAAVPAQFSLLCVSWAAQATVTGGGFVDLSRAVSGVTGTQ
ncbi:MAG: hypothetical protein EXS08_13540 [Planctomycetes bacterium]|nr:hypothetical protein [Planctomycetota bacterium]